MSQQPIAVVGDGNITSSILDNVGNRTVQNFFTGPQKGKALAMLKLKVALDALLNSAPRYPAPKCHADTRKAAQAVVTDWICGRGEWAGKGIMWISGAPGVGKSAIVQTVCELLDADNGSKVWLNKFGFRIDRKVDRCFFFGKGLGDREKASFFPATIAFQLSRSSSTCRDFIKKAIKAHPGILSETFPSQFRQLLTATANKRWPFQSPITIVIDALDECDDLDHQVELLKLMLEAVTTTKMRFLIASRPEHQIHTFFQRDDVSQYTYHIRLDEETFNTSRDIEVFLRAEFARIRRERPDLCLPLPTGEDWPGNVNIIRIRDDSDSQFIFPTLAIAFINTPFYSPDQQLQILLSAPPPRAFSKLDALYERILSRCPPDLHKGSNELLAYQTLSKAILAVIITWPEPPSAAKIAEVLERKADVVQAIILGPMRSLFKFDPSEPNSPIMLCHKSLRDYLLDIERSREFFIPSSEADALLINILSRCPPSDCSYSQDELRGVLAVVMELGNWVKVPQIASLLDVAPSVVEGVVFGPAKALFKLDSGQDVDFSVPFFRDFLLDAKRAGDYFIPSDKPDTLFTQILSRQPSCPSQSYSRGVLMGVLSVVVTHGNRLNVAQIASFLDVTPSLVEGVVFGPAKAVFKLDRVQNIDFSIPFFKDFLLDAKRAEDYFIPSDKPDTLFTQILSRQASNPSQSYSREVLIGVLSVVVAKGNWLKVPQIASFLDVAPSIVEGVVFGPAGALFNLGWHDTVDFSLPSFKDFLLDTNRAGDYFIPRDKPLDNLFTQILSRQPPLDPSQSYSREVLMGVLIAVVARGDWLNVPQIASLLDVAPNLVESVVFGPAKVLFELDSQSNVAFSVHSFKYFLLDASRAGEFFISRDKIDAHFTQILSHRPSSAPQSYSREVLMDVLRVLVVWSTRLSIAQIASFLDVDRAVVKGVVFGLPLFYMYADDDVSLILEVAAFLQDADRAGEHYIPPADLNPNYDSMYAKIRRIRYWKVPFAIQ